jgi:hypothetical protein
VSERLQEVNDVKAALAEAQASIQKKEAEIIKIHKMVSCPSLFDGSSIATEVACSLKRNALSMPSTPTVSMVEL